MIAAGGTPKLVQTLGIKSQVSVMAKDLDEQVTAFRTRPLDDGPYTFVAADALMMKVREGGRVVKVAVMVATGVNADGYREVLANPHSHHRIRCRLVGVLPRPGRPRPVRGRDGHLRRARRPGRRDWSHAAERVLATLPHPLCGQPDVRDAEEFVAVGQNLVSQIYDQPDADAVHAQFERALDALAEKLPAVAEHLESARADLLAFAAFPSRSGGRCGPTTPTNA